MNKMSISLVAAMIAFSGPAFAQEEPGMKEQAKDDWREIRETAGEAAATTAEWGRSVGRKAADLGQEAAERATEFGKDAAEAAKVVGKKAKSKATELTEKARAAMQDDAEDAQEEADAQKEPSGNRFFY